MKVPPKVTVENGQYVISDPVGVDSTGIYQPPSSVFFPSVSGSTASSVPPERISSAASSVPPAAPPVQLSVPAAPMPAAEMPAPIVPPVPSQPSVQTTPPAPIARPAGPIARPVRAVPVRRIPQSAAELAQPETLKLLERP